VAEGDECTLIDLPSKFDPAAFWSLFSGPLATASALTELLSFMYMNGMDMSTVAPTLSEYEISRLMQTHATNLQVTDANLVTARAFGSQLLAHISDTIEQLTGAGGDEAVGAAEEQWEEGGDGKNTGQKEEKQVPPSVGQITKGPLSSLPTDRLVYYAAHDINVYFIRVLLGLTWQVSY
jgi:hypothetical protein